MSMKETIHRWVDSLPDDSAGLRELYEEARLDMAIEEAEKSIAEGRVYTLEEVKERLEQKWAKRHSA
jgi:hypothetical protein